MFFLSSIRAYYFFCFSCEFLSENIVSASYQAKYTFAIFFDKSRKWKFWMLSLCSIFKKTRISPFEKRPEYLPNCMHTKLLCNEKVQNISIFKKTTIEKRPQYLHFQKGQNIPNQNICAKFYTSLKSFIHLGSAAKDWQKNSCKRDLYKILQWVVISPSW